jgi:hypothetical protein
VPGSTHLCEEEAGGKDDVCDNASADDKYALRDGPVLQEVWIVRLELVFRIVVRKRDVATQRDRSERVLDFLSLLHNTPMTSKKGDTIQMC